MSLKHALLGFLEIRPMTGYDLKKLFDTTANNYWTATHSQIYRTLTQIEKEGYANVEVVYQDNLPNKKVLHITEKGKRELRNWLTTDMEIPPCRHKLLVQLSFGDKLTNEELCGLVEKYAEKLRTKLAVYNSPEQHQPMNYARSERERFLWYRVLGNGITTYEAELAWAESFLAEFKEKFIDGEKYE